MNEITHLHPPFKRSAEVEALSKKMASMKVNEELSYAEVGAIIGEVATSSKGSSITQRARARVLQEYQSVVVCIPKQGFRKVSEPEKTDVAKGHLRKVRRSVKRGIKVISSTDITKLNGEQTIQFSVTINGLGAINQATRPGVAKKIEQAIKDSSQEVNAGYVLKLLSGTR